MIKALANVAPRHLLDRRLNPLPELRDLAARTAPCPTAKRRTPPCRSRSCGGEMRAVVQRVKRAKVVIDGSTTRKSPPVSSCSSAWPTRTARPTSNTS